MKKHLLSILSAGFIFAVSSGSALACKMTPLAGSAQTLNAVLDYVAKDSLLQSRTIQLIREEQPLSNIYLVQTTEGDTNCQVIAYKTAIEPSCAITVEQLTKKYSCTLQSEMQAK